MAKLAPVIDTLDSVAEPLREFYTPGEGGKFVLDADIEQHPGTAGMRSKVQELIRGKKAAEDRYKPFEGFDPEKVTAALSAQDKAEEEKKRAEGNFDSWKQQHLDQTTKEKQAWESEKAELTGTIQEVIGTDAARAAIVAEEGNAELLLPHVQAQVKVVKDGKAWKRVVVDKNGQTRYGPNGDEMTVRELVAEMKTKDAFKAGFKAPDVTGSGARGNDGNRGNAGDIKLTKEQAKDPAQYRRAKEEATKRGVNVIFLEH